MSSPLDRIRALIPRRAAKSSKSSARPKASLSLFRRAPTPVGIDLSPERARIVALASNQSGAAVTQAFEFPVAAGVFKGEEIVKPEQLVGVLQEEMKKRKLSRARVALAVNGGSVIVKRFMLPRMEVREALRHVPNALKLSQGDTEQMLLDLAVLDADDVKGQMQAIAVAARRERSRVRQLVALEAGLEVEAIDVDSIALFNAFASAQPDLLATRPTIVHVGDTSTVVVVADELGPLVARTLDTGAVHLLEQVMNASSSSPEEAAEFLYGPSNPIAMYAESFQHWTRPIADTVRRVGAAVPKATADASDVYLSGAVTRIQGMLELMTQRTGQEVHRFDPLATIPRAVSVPGTVDGTDYTLAIGLAMRQVG